MRTSQRHLNIRKPLCILTIHKSKTNLALKMTMTPKSSVNQGLTVCSKISSRIKLQYVQTVLSTRKASQCTGFHNEQVPTKKRYLTRTAKKKSRHDLKLKYQKNTSTTNSKKQWKRNII